MTIENQTINQNTNPVTEPFARVTHESQPHAPDDGVSRIDVSGVPELVNASAYRRRLTDTIGIPVVEDSREYAASVYEQPAELTRWQRVREQARDRTMQLGVGSLIVAAAGLGVTYVAIESAQSGVRAASEQDNNDGQVPQKTLIAEIPKTVAPVEQPHIAIAPHATPTHERTRPAPTTTAKPPKTTARPTPPAPVLEPPTPPARSKSPENPVLITPPDPGQGDIVTNPLRPYEPDPEPTPTTNPAAPLNP